MALAAGVPTGRQARVCWLLQNIGSKTLRVKTLRNKTLRVKTLEVKKLGVKHCK